ncbi:MAG: glycosyltransferase family 2 protein [Ilumatobacter sp.]|uniref:glycosyltransferase family 2 protein n=1 Tax=Ilumatobacter sp. TaxID=1967498 RepID=UPI00262B4040|nr:glycosyltransferase family 2 protein [Ilumatobacter sp.]MDJ0768697.1 glycosyltransferase family 2 protein [Ilumatobacter sp.]
MTATDEKPPRVSIGVPVYNGDNYLASALDSFLNQTYDDFEVVVSDNGSTDGTEEIAREFAARDPRVKYYRSDVNQGATWNFNRVVELARGEYFRWAAHDDTIEPDYLRRCVDVLDERPDVVLCSSRVRVIDGDGAVTEEFDRAEVPAGSPDPQDRFRGFMLHAQRCYEIFGLIRIEALRSIPPLGDYGHADGVVLARLSMLGPFVELPERLQNMRVHEEQSMYLHGCYDDGVVDYRAWGEWYNPNRTSDRLVPHWRMLWEYGRTLVITPGLSLTDRVRCVRPVVGWVRWYRPLLQAEAAHAIKRRIPTRTG